MSSSAPRSLSTPCSDVKTTHVRTSRQPIVCTSRQPAHAPSARRRICAVRLASVPFLQLWRHRDARCLPNLGVFFHSLSMVGEQVVLGWFILELTDSALMVGVALGLRNLPLLLVGIPAGVVADRGDRVKLLQASGHRDGPDHHDARVSRRASNRQRVADPGTDVHHRLRPGPPPDGPPGLRARRRRARQPRPRARARGLHLARRRARRLAADRLSDRPKRERRRLPGRGHRLPRERGGDAPGPLERASERGRHGLGQRRRLRLSRDHSARPRPCCTS